jgi:hypothetical protein
MGFVGIDSSVLDLTLIEETVAAIDWTNTWIDYTSI